MHDEDYENVEITDLPSSDGRRGITRRAFLSRYLGGGAALLIGGAAIGSALVSFLRNQHDVSGGPSSRAQQTILDIAWSPGGIQSAFLSVTNFIIQGEQGPVAAIINDVLIYEVEEKKGLSLNPSPPGKQATIITTQAWSPDNRHIALGYNDGTIALWDTRSASPVFAYRGSSGQVERVAWSPDGVYIASSGLQEIARICKASDGSLISVSTGNTLRETRPLAWSPDSTRVVMENGARSTQPEYAHPTLQVWDVGRGAPRFTFGHVDMLQAAWSPDGATIASLGSDVRLYLWNASDGTLIKHALAQSESVIVDPFSPIDLLWSPDGVYLALDTRDAVLQLWNTRSGASKLFPMHLSTTRASTWLTGKRIASIDASKTMYFLDVADL